MQHSDNPCPVLAEWRSLMTRCPEERALATVSVDISQLTDSLSRWIQLHRARVSTGEIPAEGTILDVDYGDVATCIAFLHYLVDA